MQYPILILTDETHWLTAPFNGTGLYGQGVPPDSDYTIDAQGLDLEKIKQAIFRVDTATALQNLETLGATLLIAPPQFSRRKDD